MYNIADAATEPQFHFGPTMGLFAAVELKRVHGAIIESLLTLSVGINLLKAVWRSWLRAEREVAQRGKTVGLVKSNIIDVQGRPVGRASLRQLAEERPVRTDELMFGQPAENRELEWERRRSEIQPTQIDANERLPGYLRDPHLPRFESRRCACRSAA
jgi:hypothetical protein